MNNIQEDYIEKIKEVSINPLKCSNHFYSSKQNHYLPGKRYHLSRYKIKDYLTVASNMVVFELDAPGYLKNYKIAKLITDILSEKDIPFYIFSSGGKGIHIQVWLEKPDWLDDKQKDLFDDALSFGLSFRDIRFWFWKNILDEANIPEKYRGKGKGKIIDTSCLNFNDLYDKTKLLRVCGGRKTYIDPINNNERTYYKTFIPYEEFNKTQIKLSIFNNVRYPNELKAFKLDVYEFTEFLQTFIKHAKTNNLEQEIDIDLSKNKGYLGLEGVQRVLEGLTTGQRNDGAKVLAIAMSLDKIPTQQQETIMRKYVDNCGQIGDRFTLDEAMGWITWMNSEQQKFWSCGLLKNLGLHDPAECNYCKKRFAKGNQLLTQSTILEQIENVLDVEIKGEKQTKMLMFLLMLSKDFPSSTGRPGWNIQGDPISQNIILAGDSSSGKSWTTKKILKLMGEPNIDYSITSRVTKSVLNYYTEENWDGKIIFIEELQGIDEATEMMRQWMSEGQLSLDTVEKVKDENGNEQNTKVKKTTQGHPVFITNQAEGVIEDQLNNRSWVLGMDTTAGQTKDILDYRDSLYQGGIIDIESDIRSIRDALKQLKQYHYLIPFSDNKILKIPIEEVRARRDYQKFLTLIICSGYLHQKQRIILKKDDKEFLVCNLKDYDIAKRYSDHILGATFSGLTINQIDILNHIKKSSWKDEFEVRDLMRNLGKTQPYWYGQLKQLCDLGFIYDNKQGIGKSTLYGLNEEKATTLIDLPSSNELKDISIKNLNKIFDLNYQPINNKKPITEIEKTNFFSTFIGRSEFSDETYILQTYNKNADSNLKVKSAEIFTFETAKPDLVIGLQYIDIYNLFKEKNAHILTYNELIDGLGCKDEELEKIIINMKKDGEIMEHKPNKYILL